MNRSNIAVTLLGVPLLALGAVACASIIHGTGQKLNIASVPAGATVSVDDEVVGVTPVVAKLRRNDPHTIVVKLEGYQPFQIKTTRHMDGWVLGNLVFGGPLGLIIDFSDGAAYKLKPQDIAAQLARTGANAKVESGTLYVFLTPEADSTWQKIGQLQPAR
jgi:PEGA domain-containing protein